MKKENVKSSKNTSKKNVKKNNIFSNILKYYKENMFRKHFLLYIISLIIFASIFIYSLSTYDAKMFLENVGNVVGISTILKEFIFFTLISIVLGFIPYLHLSIISIVYAARLSSYICNLLFMRTYDKTFVSIVSVFMLLILTFAITIGINICKLITKKVKNKFIKKQNSVSGGIK